MVNLSFGGVRGWGSSGIKEFQGAVKEIQGVVKVRRSRERRAGPYLRRRARIQRQPGSNLVSNMAPGNTTQFLMGDNKRTFSDSDLDNSTDEDENEFGKKEFSRDYDLQKPIRQKLSKSKLIEEFMTVEKDVKMLEKKYAEMSAEEQLKARLGTVDYDWRKGEVAMEPEVAEKIRIFQEEILRMAQENRSLMRENSRLISEKRAAAVSSSSSDSSSSDSSDNSSSASSSEDDSEVEEAAEEVLLRQEGLLPASCLLAPKEEEWQKDDTGYESDRSVVSSTGGGRGTV